MKLKSKLERLLTEQILLSVSDNGIGLPSNFNFIDTASLGWQLVDALASQLAGDININSNEWSGVSDNISNIIIRLDNKNDKHKYFDC